MDREARQMLSNFIGNLELAIGEAKAQSGRAEEVEQMQRDLADLLRLALRLGARGQTKRVKPS
jgi:hypothetical protein